MSLILIALVLNFCILHVKGLEVNFQKTQTTKEEKESLVLNCKLKYEHNVCDIPEAFWVKVLENNGFMHLKEENKYLTMLSENDTDDQNVKERLISTEIKKLTLSDSGSYRCKAQANCSSIRSAIGHSMTLIVKKAEFNSRPKNCGIRWNKVEDFSLFLCPLLALYFLSG